MEGTKPQLIFENLWRKDGTPFHEEVKLLWNKHFPDLTEDQLNVRLNQVVFALRTEAGKVVGVSTSHKAYIQQLRNHLYSFRCFIEPKHRIPGLDSALVVKTRDLLEAIHQTDGEEKDRCIGMITLVENERIMKVRNEAIWRGSGMVYIGNAKSGKHLRVYYFKKVLI